ncbi:MAG: hypothetical protein R3F60_04455 [bacterium]
MTVADDHLAQARATDDPAEADRLAIAAVLADPGRGEAYALRGQIAARRGDAVTAAHHFRAAWLRGDRSAVTRAAYAVCLEVTDRGAEAAEVSGGAMVPAELEAFSEVARMLGPAIRGILALPLPPTGEPMLLPGERRPSGAVPSPASRTSTPPRPAQASTPPRGIEAPFARPLPERAQPPARPSAALFRRAPSAPPDEAAGPPSRPPGMFSRTAPSTPPSDAGWSPPSRPSGAFSRTAPSTPPGDAGWSPPSRPSGAFSRTAPSTPPAEISARPPSAPPADAGWSSPPRRVSRSISVAPPPADDQDWLEPRHTLREAARPSSRESWVDDSMVPMSAGEDGPRFEASPLELVVDPGVPDAGVRSPVTGELISADEAFRARQDALMPELELAGTGRGRASQAPRTPQVSRPPQPPVRHTRPLHGDGASLLPEPTRPAPREEADLLEAAQAFVGVDRLRLALKLPGPVMTATGARPQQLCVAVAFGLTPDEVLMRDRQRPDAPPVRIAFRALARLDVVRDGAQITMTLGDARQLHLDLRELMGRAPALGRVLVAELASSVRGAGMQVVGA